MKKLILAFAFCIATCQLWASCDAVISLDNLVRIDNKSLGLNSGGIYLDHHGTRFIIKTPQDSASVADEFIVSHLLKLLGVDFFADAFLIKNQPDQVASKFIQGFSSLKDYAAHNLSDFKFKNKVIGRELFVVVRNWLGIEDENNGNIGVISLSENQLQLTRIDYDTAFHFGKFKAGNINFHLDGVAFLDDDLLIEALDKVISIPINEISKTLQSIYLCLDDENVPFSHEKRESLIQFLIQQGNYFATYSSALKSSKAIINLIHKNDIDAARKIYWDLDLATRSALQHEWFFEHSVHTREEYRQYIVSVFPDVLENSSSIRDFCNSTVLHKAAEWNDQLLLMALSLKENVNLQLNTINCYGFTPKDTATYFGFVHINSFLEADNCIIKEEVNSNDCTTDTFFKKDFLHYALEGQRLANQANQALQDELYVESIAYANEAVANRYVSSLISASEGDNLKAAHQKEYAEWPDKIRAKAQSKLKEKIVALQKKADVLGGRIESISEVNVLTDESVLLYEEIILQLKALIDLYRLSGNLNNFHSAWFWLREKEARLNTIRARMAYVKKDFNTAIIYGKSALDAREAAAMSAEIFHSHQKALHQREHSGFVRILMRQSKKF